MANEKIYAVFVIALLSLLMVELYYPGGIVGVFNPTEPTETTTTTTEPPEGVEVSQFKFTPVKKDATGTAVTGATVRIWYDQNSDGKMQYNELGYVTESSGTYTSVNEYPIGDGYKFWAQVQASNYFTRYLQMYMTGSRNSGGEAKTASIAQGSIEMTYMDDSVTYKGLIGTIAWDDGDDFNVTTQGAGDYTAQIFTTLSAEDKGIENSVWSNVDYEYVYSGLESSDADKTEGYWVKWDEVSDEGIAKFYAPTFLGIHMTDSDATAGSGFGMSSSDWDMSTSDGTNTYFSVYQDSNVGFSDYFYRSSDSVAPEPSFSFTMDVNAAAAAINVGWYIDVEYGDWMDGNWPTGTAANYLGTLGSDWDVISA